MMFNTFYRGSNKKPTVNSDKGFVSCYNKSKENNRYGLPKINYNSIKIDRPSYQTLQEFYALCETRHFNSKIGSVRSKPIVPTLNTEFLENHTRLLQYKQNNRKLQQRAISIENQKYQNRIFTTRSAFLRLYGKKFEKSHDERINKIYLKSNKIQILPKTNKGNSVKKKIVIKDNKTDIDSVNTFDLNQQNQGKRPRRSDIEEFEQDFEENIKDKNKNKNNENNKKKNVETIKNENNNNKKNKDTINCEKNRNNENKKNGNKDTINSENIKKNSSSNNNINGINNKNNNYSGSAINKEKNINSHHNNNEDDRHNNNNVKNVQDTNKNNNNESNNSNNNRGNDINDKEDSEEF